MQQNRYIDALLSHNEKIIADIYKNFFPPVEYFIINNNGTKRDAQDIFQKALMIVFLKAKRTDFKLTCKFNYFLNRICQWQWKNELRRKTRKYISVEGSDVIIENPIIEQRLLMKEQESLYQEKFNELTPRGQMLLKLFFEGKKHEEIADIMGFANADVAKKQKCVYQAQLIEKIKKDRRYRELKFGTG